MIVGFRSRWIYDHRWTMSRIRSMLRAGSFSFTMEFSANTSPSNQHNPRAYHEFPRLLTKITELLNLWEMVYVGGLNSCAHRPDGPPYCPPLCAVISLAIRLLVDHQSHIWWPRLSSMTHTAFPFWWDSNWVWCGLFFSFSGMFNSTSATILAFLYSQSDISWPKCCSLVVAIPFHLFCFSFPFFVSFLFFSRNLFETNQNGSIVNLCSCSMTAMFLCRVYLSFGFQIMYVPSLFQHQQRKLQDHSALNKLHFSQAMTFLLLW